MTRLATKAAAVFIAGTLIFTGCSSTKLTDKNGVNLPQTTNNSINSTNMPTLIATPVPTAAPSPLPTQAPVVDYEKIKPNEAGKIMVVMFHSFIAAYTSGDKEYTTTFNDFRTLLQTLYDKSYRLINVNDYLSNNINVPAGCVPIIFTFDDGTAGQFNLVEENGVMKANTQSAVGIMEEFNKKHPDFGLKGTFYVNLGLKTFEGRGTVSDRLKYLVDKGFEIGNHTLTHISLPQVKSVEKIQQEVGGNQKKMYEFIPGYTFKSLALPYGQSSRDLQGYVAKGEYEGVNYENLALMEVGAGPTLSPVHRKSTPLFMSRVRATGITPVQADLAWWLNSLSRNDEYISDGNPETVTVPKAKEAEVDREKLKGKELKTY